MGKPAIFLTAKGEMVTFHMSAPQVDIYLIEK